MGRDDFESFVRATGPLLHRAALLLTGDHHRAEDLTQMTYAKVHSRWRKVRLADSPVAFTRTIMLRLFLSERRLKRNSEKPVADVPEGGTMAEHESRLDLLEALSRLSPEDRAVLMLRYWADESVAATAFELGLSEGNVRSRSKRALARLRDQLGYTAADLPS